MSEEGRNIVKIIKEIKKFNENISLLLKTADDIMIDKGWDSYSNTVIADSSAHRDSPKQWYPHYLFRFYMNNDKKNLLLYVSLLIDDDVWGDFKITEPLVTAGYFDYGHNQEINGSDWEYLIAKWFGYLEEKKADGSIVESERNWKDKWQKDWGKDFKRIKSIESWKCFGVPLTSITNPQDIKTKVIKPLIELVPK